MKHIKLRKRDSGATVVEFAICILIFIVLILSAFDFAYLFYAKVTIQNAVRQAGRFAITGNCGPGVTNCFANDPNNRINTILNIVTTYSFGLNPTISVTCPGGCPSYSAGTGSTASDNAGGPSNTVNIAATYTWHPFILTPFFGTSYTFTEYDTFRNEPFAPPAP